MSKENKVVIRRVTEEVWNEHNPDAADEFVAPDVVTSPMVREHQHGIDGYKYLVRRVHAAFPDLHFDIEDIIPGGEKGATRMTLNGTHEGEIRNIPLTGRRFPVEYVHWFRLAVGEAAEHWAARDDLGQMQQLGVISMPERAEA